MSASNEVITVALGCLLHDIGKFAQRAAERRSSHVQAGSDFYQDLLAEKVTAVLGHEAREKVRAIIANHHDAHEFPVQMADWTASGERLASEQEEDPSIAPLICVWSQVRGVREDMPSQQQPARMVWPLRPLGAAPSACFPVEAETCSDEDVRRAYGDLWRGFCEQVRELRCPDGPSLLCSLRSLLERYTWCVPSAVYKTVPDISLYDHLRTTAAVGSALAVYHAATGVEPNMDSPCLLLVAGDLSGIQQYIFSFGQVKKARPARRLRARSFLLSVFARWAAQRLLSRFGVTPLNELMTAGGKFYLLLPAVPNHEQVLCEEQDLLDRLADQHFARLLTLNLAWTVCSCQELSNAGPLLARFDPLLAARKLRPFHSLMCEEGHWRAESHRDGAFVGQPFGANQVLCEICQQLPADRPADEAETAKCHICVHDEKIGRRLPQAIAVAYSKNGLEAAARDLPGNFADLFDLVSSTDTERDWSGYRIECIRFDEQWPRWLTRYEHWESPTANYIPRQGVCGVEAPSLRSKADDEQHVEPGAPLTFEHLAAAAKGSSAIAVLKADVDRMGKIFRVGLSDGEKLPWSRLATASRSLSWFFGAHLHDLLADPAGPYRYVYTVYSGGDDLLLVGPWDAVIASSRDLNQRFRQYVCRNPHITWTGAVTVSRTDTPISILAEISERRLQQAKDQDFAARPGRGRNQLSIVDSLVPWEHLDALFDRPRQLLTLVEQGRLPKSLLWTLRWAWQQWRDYTVDRRLDALRWVPILTYQFRRNLPVEPDDPDLQRMCDWLWAIRNEGLKADTCDPNMIALKFVVDYVLLATRKKEAENGEAALAS